MSIASYERRIEFISKKRRNAQPENLKFDFAKTASVQISEEFTRYLEEV